MKQYEYEDICRVMAERMGYNVRHAISYNLENMAYEFARIAFRYAMRSRPIFEG